MRKAALLLPLLACGCQTVGAITGAVAGAATGTGTANPLVGYAVGVTVAASVDELEHYIARLRAGAEHAVIATAVAGMRPGEVRDWQIVHDIPEFDNEGGQVQVLRTIDTPLTECKEVLFTVDHGKGARRHSVLFTTHACHDTEGWRWAEAEPATERWGYLQHRNF